MAKPEFIRIAKAWVDCPKSQSECNCGGELKKKIAQGNGVRSLVCVECDKRFYSRS